MTFRPLQSFSFRLLFVVAVIVGAVYVTNATSSITGTVYDLQRNRIGDVDVELLGDFYQNLGRQRTDSTGRFQFQNLRDGRYTVRVYAFRYDLEDKEEQVEIFTRNIRGGEGMAMILQDFYLMPRKGGLREAEVGFIFAQEVPAEARKLYDNAIKDLNGKRVTEGLTGLNAAIQKFPDYFDALLRLGKEMLVRGMNSEAAQCFFHAGRVNNKSATSFYYLGLALHNMGKEYDRAAIKSLQQAQMLAPNVAQVLYHLGKFERASSDFVAAEKHLLGAKKAARDPIAEVHYELFQLYENNLRNFAAAADELELFLKATKLSEADKAVTKKKISDLRAQSGNNPGS